MVNITYLLGAGASAEAIPTNRSDGNSKTLSDSFTDSSDLLDNWLRSLAPNQQETQFTCKEKISELRQLSLKSKKFGTMDMYAKYLYVKKCNDELTNLKRVLSFHFILQQLDGKKFDQRSLAFLTTLMEKGPKFPDNIKIISWNYDMQIQIAANELLKEQIKIYGQRITHTSLIPYYPNLSRTLASESGNIEKYSLVQMNGIAGNRDEGNASFSNPIVSFNISDIPSLLAWDSKHSIYHRNVLTFAWENDEKDPYDTTGCLLRSYSMRIAEHIAKQTEVLVIIGYSFPFFNREYDNKIMGIMKSNAPKFQKIYFQDRYLSGEFLDKQFNITRDVPVLKNKIEYISKCDNYFIPPEL